MALWIAASSALTSGSLGAQRVPTSERVDIANQVMSYRYYWLADSTRFSACALFRALGRPADFPGVVQPQLRRLLDRQDADPCAPPRDFEYDAVAVLSISDPQPGDSLAHLDASVRHGEYSHRAQYTLARLQQHWFVREVLLTTGLQGFPTPEGRLRRREPRPASGGSPP
jgi:hypothetical protein